MNMTAPRARILFGRNGAAYETISQGLAFDSDAALPLIVWTYIAPGQYRYTFPETEYPDENGNLVTLDFDGGAAFLQTEIAGQVAPRAEHVRVGARTGDIRIVASNGASLVELPDLGRVLLLLW
jgi:hypothetical protein